MDELGYGKDYKYAHDYEGGFVADNYWPEKLAQKAPRLVHLTGRGAEKTLLERLRQWWGSRFEEEGNNPGGAGGPARETKETTSGGAGGPAREMKDEATGGAGRSARDLSGEGLQVKRRRLPHWRLTGSVYFVTWNLKEGQQDLTEEERDLLVEIIRFGNRKRYELYAFVVMNDHIHAVLRPLEGEKLDKILHTWKSYSANQLQRKHHRQGSIWLQEGYDRIIRDEDDLLEKCEYTLGNPFRRWPELKEYKWMGTE
jgi:REP element-mobilizing transposase RayT